MFRTRLISGIVLVALALLFIITGGPVLLTVTCIISLIGMFELYRVFKMQNSVVAWIGYIAAIAYYLNLQFHFIEDRMILFLMFLTALLAAYVLSYPKFHADQIMAGFFGVFYVAVCLSYIYNTRMLPGGKYGVWLIFLCSWGCDTCAYCFGKLFGKHKMSPILSPKKSVEGGVGGVVGAALLIMLYCWIFRAHMNIDTREIFLMGLCGAAGALISMVGDLAASAIKRNYNIKDYGKIIPGHGGILDRFDSVIITAPIVFYLIDLVIL